MESETVERVISEFLSPEELSQIPEETRTKLEKLLEEKFEELLRVKALFETRRLDSEKNVQDLQNEVADFKSKYADSESRLNASNKTIEELESQISTFTSEMAKLQDTCNRLEASTAEFRHQKDLIIDERDNLLKMVERRNTEVERLQTDVNTLSAQLNSAINAKCEALAKADEVASMKVNLDFRERHMEQERAFMANQIQNLTEDLNKRNAELQNSRHENSSQLIILETKLSKKSEELRIANEKAVSLANSNNSLSQKAEELAEKLLKQREAEAKLQESFHHELQAQTRLAELYKGLCDENNAQTEELKKGIVELQGLLRNTSEQYGELETKMREAELEHDELLCKKNECIALLKKELDGANELLKSAKEECLHRDMESLSPAAAVASKLLKSGTSLTHIYSQYVQVSDELMLEKEETRRLNSYINKIVQEFEDRTPVLQKEREEYEQAIETISELTKHNDGMVLECHRLREDCADAKKLEARAVRENDRMKKEIADLSRQVCFLLKEIEASRAVSTPSPERDMSLSDSISSADIISKKLVTFADIQELQANNQKLLALVRELSSKQEEAECLDAAGIVHLKDRLHSMQESHADMLKEQERLNKVLDGLIRQRDMYKGLCQRSARPRDEDMTVDMSAQGDASAPQPPPDPDRDQKIRELSDKHAAALKELDQLRDEYESYKKEKCASEKIVIEQLESLRKKHHDVIQANANLTTKCEYNDERFKIMKGNLEVCQKQITSLEEKNKINSETVIKYEQSIMHFKDKALHAQEQLSNVEVRLQNAQQECSLLRSTKARLLQEREAAKRDSQGQALLLSNLELIKASLERNEAEGRVRLEARVDESLRECSALRRRLQEEQDKFRELSNHLERQAQSAHAKMEEEKQEAERVRTQLHEVRQQLTDKGSQLEELTKKLKNSMLLSREGSEDSRVKDLENQINENIDEIAALRKQLATMKESNNQYMNIAEFAEKELREEHERSKELRDAADKQLQDSERLVAELRDKVSLLTTELSLQSSGQQETAVELRGQLGRLRDELGSVSEELSSTRVDLEAARAEVKALSEAVQCAEQKYAHEMVLHSADLQALAAVKAELATLSGQVDETRLQRDQAREALETSKLGFQSNERLLREENEAIAGRLKELDEQNRVLHDQIQALSTQLSVLHAQVGDTSLNQSADTSLNRSLNEDDLKSSEQLLQIIKYLRREKDLAITKFEVLLAENARLKSQQQIAERQLEEARSALAAERETTEISVVTAAKHDEILRKVETLNAITDSNKILREERDTLKNQTRELARRATALEEQLAPLQERNKELTVKAEVAQTENVALKAEATRWRQRANMLVEKANKVSPEDWRRIQNERESLAKMLSAEKDAHKKLAEEAAALRQDKARLEEQVNGLTVQTRNQLKDTKKLSDELAHVRQQVSRLSQEVIEAREVAAQRTDENTKITEDLASKDVMLTDIRAKENQVRRIAKKYKTQYEDLMKSVEEDKKKQEDRANAGPADVPSEAQEQFREEGRREVELRLTELEKSLTERLSELNAQLAAAQEENDVLRKENEGLRSLENEKDERTKLVLKAAKLKITELTEERNKIRRELNELRGRLESLEQGKDESRVSRLEKEKNDIIAEKQQERERQAREIDTLSQRVTQLQRQLGLLPASKPSTSAGSSDKSGSDPPTANIKPMSGHSNVQQQSATVMPWRGGDNTPFASIRPMSQLRTVAVLPTSQSQSSSGSGQSAAVLVPPQQQQQLVHTTGSSSIEVMSSSPTSSHTDYMPATSSASPAVPPIRQVAVPPTQQATIGMSSRDEPPSAAESTQDMEAETEGQPAALQQQQQQQQQAVAMVLPRVEQQAQPNQAVVEQSASTSAAVAASSQQASSSSTVTTTQAGLKRPRENEGDSSTSSQPDDQAKSQQQTKRARTQGAQDVFQGVTDSGVEVEYQVPTSSQRDQEDDVIVLSEDEEGPDEGEGDATEGMEDPDDGPFEESGDGVTEAYEMEALAYEPEQELTYDDADCQEIDEEPANEDNNEVEIIDDSSEVPNQSGSSSSVSGAPDASLAVASQSVAASDSSAGPAQGAQSSQSEAISSGSEGTSGVTLSQAAPSMTIYPRNRNVTPLSRQQQSHLLLPHGFEETGDDGIVPSTPTLYVPRRTDGFGEAVSSPHVPSGRFTFNDTAAGAARGSGLAQPAAESLEDARADLAQLDDSGTGRSVPSTPLQVSPQGEQAGAEGSAEVGPSIEEQPPEQTDGTQALTEAAADDEPEAPQEGSGESAAATMAGTSGEGSHRLDPQDEAEDLLEGEEGTDGVSSEGEKAQAIEESDMEEGREAEASETPSSNTRSRGVARGSGTARRSRVSFRGRSMHRPTPIVWSEQNSPRQQQQQQDVSGNRPRGIILMEGPARGNFASRSYRSRRMRQMRSAFGRF